MRSMHQQIVPGPFGDVRQHVLALMMLDLQKKRPLIMYSLGVIFNGAVPPALTACSSMRLAQKSNQPAPVRTPIRNRVQSKSLPHR